jgi:hypothetical protein
MMLMMVMVIIVYDALHTLELSRNLEVAVMGF